MKRSNYPIWFRRLVVLGAVAAGLAASAAAAAPSVPDYGPYPISGGTGFIQEVTYPTNIPDRTGVSGCALGPHSTCALAS
jgi:hypothetical protein